MFTIQKFNSQHYSAGEQCLRRKLGNVKGTKPECQVDLSY